MQDRAKDGFRLWPGDHVFDREPVTSQLKKLLENYLNVFLKSGIRLCFAFGVRTGPKWALKEFQKDLWGLEHSALKISMIQAPKQVFSIYTGTLPVYHFTRELTWSFDSSFTMTWLFFLEVSKKTQNKYNKNWVFCRAVAPVHCAHLSFLPF